MTPKALETPDFAALKKVCDEYIKFLESEDYHEDNDFDNYIFEAAMDAIYGPKIWDFVNEKLV
jgi:hypothetical protein